MSNDKIHAEIHGPVGCKRAGDTTLLTRSAFNRLKEQGLVSRVEPKSKSDSHVRDKLSEQATHISEAKDALKEGDYATMKQMVAKLGQYKATGDKEEIKDKLEASIHEVEG